MVQFSEYTYADLVNMAVNVVRSEQAIFMVLRHIRLNRTNLKNIIEVLGENHLELFQCEKSNRKLGLVRHGSKRYMVMKRFCTCPVFQSDVLHQRSFSCKHEIAFRLLSVLPPTKASIHVLPANEFSSLLFKQSQSFLIADELARLGNPKNLFNKNSEGETYVSTTAFAGIGVDSDSLKTYFDDAEMLQKESRIGFGKRKTDNKERGMLVTAEMFLDVFSDIPENKNSLSLLNKDKETAHEVERLVSVKIEQAASMNVNGVNNNSYILIDSDEDEEED